MPPPPVQIGLICCIKIRYYNCILIRVLDDLNRSSGIEREDINSNISKVSDLFINAGLKLDNPGSIKAFL